MVFPDDLIYQADQAKKNFLAVINGRLKGKKTFMIIGACLVFGILQGLDIYTLPKLVWVVFAVTGATTARLAITDIAKAVAAIIIAIREIQKAVDSLKEKK